MAFPEQAAVPARLQVSDQFDLVSDLPVHPIAVSVLVVALPLSSVLLILVVLIPKLRRAIGWLLMVLLAVVVGLAYVAQESGTALAGRLGRPQAHADLGQLVLWFALAQFVVGFIWFLTARVRQSRASRAATAKRPEPPAPAAQDPYGGLTGGIDPITGQPLGGSQPAPTQVLAQPSSGPTPLTLILGIAAIVVAGLNLFLAFRAGQTGMAATWQARVAGEIPAASPTPSLTPAVSPSAELATPSQELTPPPSSTPSDGVSGSPWTSPSPSLSGVTAAPPLPSQSTQQSPMSPQQRASTPADTSGLPGYTQGEVAVHNRAESCWIVVDDRVYDLTSWLPTHQSAAPTLTELCGTDATGMLQDAAGAPIIPERELLLLQIGVRE